ncbi:3204_t:CDS:2 [Cetraspora pellucida]|uniref:3204_t:CDS:1 n=1 Tax=Cetraspora pellucida TaxID=1433469 RepID=A0A9N9DEQ2_9GLOM|nr:3204_t:CDS:2 [Cetraspora pellucida]
MTFFHWGEFDPNLSVTSWFVSSRTLKIFRVVVTVYSWIILIGHLLDYGLYTHSLAQYVHYHAIIPFVYWGLLSQAFLKENNPWFIWLINVSVHGMEFVTMMIELFLNRQLMKKSFVFITIPIQILFMFEAFLVYDEHNFWIYDFLDWHRGSPGEVASRYIGFFLAFIAVYFLVYGIHAFRDFIGRKKKKSQKSSENIAMSAVA